MRPLFVTCLLCALTAGCQEPNTKQPEKYEPARMEQDKKESSPSIELLLAREELDKRIALKMAEIKKQHAADRAEIKKEYATNLAEIEERSNSQSEAATLKLAQSIERFNQVVQKLDGRIDSIAKAPITIVVPGPPETIHKLAERVQSLEAAVRNLADRVEKSTGGVASRRPTDDSEPRAVPLTGRAAEQEQEASRVLERARFFDDVKHVAIYREKLENVRKSFPGTAAAIEAAKLIQGLGDSTPRSSGKPGGEAARPPEPPRGSAPPHAAKEESEIKRSKSKSGRTELIIRMESPIERELVGLYLDFDQPVGSFSESNTEISIGVVAGEHTIIAKLPEHGWPQQSYRWLRRVAVGQGETVELSVPGLAGFAVDPGFPTSWRR